MSEGRCPEPRCLAFRQAGYAVALYAQGRRLPDLSLEAPAADPARAGAPAGSGRQVDLGSRSRHRIELEILARWAGLLSESRACLGDREPPGGWGAALDPLAALARRVTRHPGEDEAYLEWLRRRALGLIDLPGIWAAVEAVAERLVAEGRASSAAVSEVIARARPIHRPRIGLAGLFRNPR